MIEDEGNIRDAWRRQDFDRALKCLLDRYGAQLLGYLCALARDQIRGREVYSFLVEDLWRGLPTFEWRCAARVWAFKLARNAHCRYVAGELRRARHEELVGRPRWLRELIDRTRSPTPVHMRSEVRHRVRELRARLDEHEQTLLMLRVDRQLAWQDLAVVLDEVREGEAIASAAARLRQRFQVLKTKLRGLAEAEGLFNRDDV